MVERYTWQCPQCRRGFEIPVGNFPDLCPDCRVSTFSEDPLAGGSPPPLKTSSVLRVRRRRAAIAGLRGVMTRERFGILLGGIVLGVLLTFGGQWAFRPKVRTVGDVFQEIANMPIEDAPESEWPKLVKVFRGTGRDGFPTDPVTVDDDWELRWEFRQYPYYFNVNSHAPDGRMYPRFHKTHRFVPEPSRVGRFTFVNGGNFSFDVSEGFSGGPWKLEVWQNSNLID